MVLLRIIENKNLIFFTNYSSAKAHQLEENSYAAMTIYWPSFERQVRVRGTVTKSPPAQSQDYFSKRPRGAQIGAWASRQSQVIGSRQELLKAYEEVKKKYGDQEIKCPQHWGGMVFSPYYFEFWQGRENRLHDRFSYSFEHEKLWTIARLMP
jgi:pyridoxamine 5'-phosphate oxidase